MRSGGLFFICLVMMGSCGSSQNKVECDVLNSVFNAGVFYSLPSLNLSYVDTIRIIDGLGYFKECDREFEIIVSDSVLNPPRTYEGESIKSVPRKVVQILSETGVDPALIGRIPIKKDLKVKYANCFLTTANFISKDQISLELIKLDSNHKINLEYKCEYGMCKLIGSSVGQF